MPRFVLDHNFPLMTTGIKWPPGLTLESLEYYDERLIQDHEDWQVIRELDRRREVDGYITNDAAMLKLAPEMVALHISRLILVVTDGPHNDPLAATGLLMTHLVEVVKRERGQRRGQLYVLSPRDLGKQREHVPKLLEDIAKRHHADRDQMISRERKLIEAWPGLPPKPPAPQFPPLGGNSRGRRTP